MSQTTARNREIHRRCQERRDETRDWAVPPRGKARKARTDLGLELLMGRAKHGVGLTYDDIAAWTGTTYAAIRNIELDALKHARSIVERERHDGFKKEFLSS